MYVCVCVRARARACVCQEARDHRGASAGTLAMRVIFDGMLASLATTAAGIQGHKQGYPASASPSTTASTQADARAAAAAAAQAVTSNKTAAVESGTSPLPAALQAVLHRALAQGEGAEGALQKSHMTLKRSY